MERLGFTLNTMTLGGLAIAIGEVVDDAVIDVENIFRRLQENRRDPHPRPAIRVVFDASIEVRSAVVYATFIVALVFVPVLTMSGLAGRIFAPLGIAYILSILASLAIALTVTPPLCFIFLGRGGLKDEDPPLITLSQEEVPFSSFSRWAGHRGRSFLPASLSLCSAWRRSPFFSPSFLPELSEGHFILHVSAVPGTSLGESLRIGTLVASALKGIPNIRSVAQRVGRAEAEADVFSTNSSEFEGRSQAEPHRGGDPSGHRQTSRRPSDNSQA